MKKTIPFFNLLLFTLIGSMISSVICSAQPYGKGLYNSDVPYGSQTTLSIATSGNTPFSVAPSSSGSISTGTSTVTITSTDVKGYKLYIRAVSDTNMMNGGTSLPASANGTPAALAVNTWGYNTDASSNYMGITMSDALIKSVTTPTKSGDITNVTFGVNVDMLKPMGNYSTTVIYTAVPQTD